MRSNRRPIQRHWSRQQRAFQGLQQCWTLANPIELTEQEQHNDSAGIYCLSELIVFFITSCHHPNVKLGHLIRKSMCYKLTRFILFYFFRHMGAILVVAVKASFGIQFRSWTSICTSWFSVYNVLCWKQDKEWCWDMLVYLKIQCVIASFTSDK